MSKAIAHNKKKDRKVRKIYHLDREDTVFVREYAQKKGMSESEVIRLAVRSLQGRVEEDPFWKLIGSVEVGPGQAKNHDEAIWK